MRNHNDGCSTSAMSRGKRKKGIGLTLRYVYLSLLFSSAGTFFILPRGQSHYCRDPQRNVDLCWFHRFRSFVRFHSCEEFLYCDEDEDVLSTGLSTPLLHSLFFSSVSSRKYQLHFLILMASFLLRSVARSLSAQKNSASLLLQSSSVVPTVANVRQGQTSTYFRPTKTISFRRFNGRTAKTNQSSKSRRGIGWR